MTLSSPPGAPSLCPGRSLARGEKDLVIVTFYPGYSLLVWRSFFDTFGFILTIRKFLEISLLSIYNIYHETLQVSKVLSPSASILRIWEAWAQEQVLHFLLILLFHVSEQLRLQACSHNFFKYHLESRFLTLYIFQASVSFVVKRIRHPKLETEFNQTQTVIVAFFYQD